MSKAIIPFGICLVICIFASKTSDNDSNSQQNVERDTVAKSLPFSRLIL